MEENKIKIYWENGFYPEQSIDGTRKEITTEEYNRLLEGAGVGKEIYTRDDGHPDLRDRETDPKEAYIMELSELKQWFDKIYTYQEQKYRRLDSLNIPDDDGVVAKTKLSVLYSEAETKRKRIQEIEKVLEGSNGQSE